MKRLYFAISLLNTAISGTEVNIQDPNWLRDQRNYEYKDDVHTHHGGKPHAHDNNEYDSNDSDEMEAPDLFGNAVSNFNIADIFIDEDCYQRQIDIYSD